MFRKTYKNLMDDIKPNEDLKQMLINEALKAEKKPPIKVNLYRRVYAVTGFVAAVAATFVAVVVLDSNELSKNDDMVATVTPPAIVKPQTEVVSENEISEIIDISATTEKNEKQANKTTAEAVKVNEPRVISDIPEVNFDSVILSDETQNAESVTDEITEDYSVESKVTEEIVSEEAKSSGGSAAPANNFMMRTMQTDVDELKLEEYNEYLGFDLMDALNLPSDMKREASDTVSIIKDTRSGEILYDAHSFYFTGDDMRYINIITSKCDDAPEIFGAEKKIIGNREWNVFSDNENTTAQTVKEDVNITVDSFGLTEREQENLLISINEIQKNEKN